MYNPFKEDKRLPFGESGDLEGDYGSYIHQWTLALPDNQGVALRIGFFIDDLRDLLYIWYEDGANDRRFAVYNLVTQVQIFLSPAAAHYTPTITNNMLSSPTGNLSAYSCASSRQRYVVLLRDDGDTFEVWKDGALLNTDQITNYDAGAWVELLHMSQRGRWLIVYWSDDVFIFEGQ